LQISEFFGVHAVLDVSPEEKVQEQLNSGFWEAKIHVQFRRSICLGISHQRRLLTDRCSDKEIRPAVGKCRQRWVDHQLEETKTTPAYPKMSYRLFFFSAKTDGPKM
jgi:hypothetical protein